MSYDTYWYPRDRPLPNTEVGRSNPIDLKVNQWDSTTDINAVASYSTTVPPEGEFTSPIIADTTRNNRHVENAAEHLKGVNKDIAKIPKAENFLDTPEGAAAIGAGIEVLNQITKAINTAKAQPKYSELAEGKQKEIRKRGTEKYFGKASPKKKKKKKYFA